MIALDGVVIGVSVVAATLATIRWARVAQREHYLVGSVMRFTWRWWTRRPLDAAMAIVAMAAAVASGFVAGVGLLSAAVVAVGPTRLGLRGRTSPLRWTRRLRTAVASQAALTVVILGVVAGTTGLRATATAAVAVAVAVPLLIECALLIDRPIETVVARRFVRSARARLELVAPVVVAITGSYGKTSTKRYLEHLVSGSRRVVASPRSFNNAAGLARAVNESLPSGTEVFIAEMGTYGPGEIAAMVGWTRPKIAAITAIGPVHLERFHSLERTLRAKREIFLTAETAVLNVDDIRLAQLADELGTAGLRVVTCSTRSSNADVAVVESAGRILINIARQQVGVLEVDPRAPIASANVACALGLASALGVDPAALVDRLRSLPAVEHRLDVSLSPSGVVVLDDTYNANPTGATRALRALVDNGNSGGRRVVVTPGMVELGMEQADANRTFAADISAAGAELVVVGSTNRRALLAGVAGDGGKALMFSTREQAVAWVRGHLGPGDAVLYENDLPDHYP